MRETLFLGDSPEAGASGYCKAKHYDKKNIMEKKKIKPVKVLTSKQFLKKIRIVMIPIRVKNLRGLGKIMERGFGF